MRASQAQEMVQRPLDGNKFCVLGEERLGWAEHREWWGVVRGERTEPGQGLLTGLGGELGFRFVCDRKPVKDFFSRSMRRY